MSEYIIGSDEGGTGAWAGPFYVCAVAVPKTWKGPPKLTDSKELTPEERLELYPALRELPLALICAPVEYLDTTGLKRALPAAHAFAIRVMLERFPGADIVVDGTLCIPGFPQARSIPHADALFPSVSAASVIAKVNRDAFMVEQHKMYPHYDWASNKGYRSATHLAGLDSHGVSPAHRRSYGPIRDILEKI